MIPQSEPIRPVIRVLLARGVLSQKPDLYVVRWCPILASGGPEGRWTWVMPYKGLSLISAESNREVLRNEWFRVARRCRFDSSYFDSLLRRSPIELPITTEWPDAVNST